MRRRFLIFTLFSVSLVAGACGDSDDNGDGATKATDKPGAVVSDGATFGVKGLAWDPEEITVKVGDTVRWKWDENLAHNIESGSDEEFGTDKKNLQKADVTHVFEEAGTYKFTCTLHSNMDGTVEVEK